MVPVVDSHRPHDPEPPVVGEWLGPRHVALEHWSLISLCVGDLLQIRRELVSDPAGEYNEDEGVGSHGNCVKISDVATF